MNIEKISVAIGGRTPDGKGIVYTDHGAINIGPVQKDSIGERLEVLSIDGYVVHLLDYPPRPKNFLEQQYPEQICDLDRAELFTIQADDRLEGRGVVVSQLEDGDLELGPLSDDSIGNQLTAYYLTGNFALCLEPPYFQKRYSQYCTKAASPQTAPLPDPLSEFCTVNNSDEFTYREWDELCSTGISTDYKQDDFALGMLVHDNESTSPSDAVVVNLPPITAEEFVAYHDGERGVTVAEDNPKYDSTSNVIIVIFENELEKYLPGYNGGKALKMSRLSSKNIPFYAFPPGRLNIVEEGHTISEKGKIKSEIHRENNSKDRDVPESETEPSIAADPTTQNTPFSPENGQTPDSDNDTSSESTLESQTLSDNEEPVSKQEPTETQSANDSNVTSRNSADSVQTPQNKNQKDNQRSYQSSSGKYNPEQKTKSTLESDSEKARQTSIPDETLELRKLREKAEEEATKDPIRKNIEYTGSKYERSEAIREYALARADGTCEVCGQEAPFVKPDGSPYLEVHHVDELGEGGADHPSLVAALCPTCHKEIHHGKRGDVINEQLRKRLEQGLGEVGATEELP